MGKESTSAVMGAELGSTGLLKVGMDYLFRSLGKVEIFLLGTALTRELGALVGEVGSQVIVPESARLESVQER